MKLSSLAVAVSLSLCAAGAMAADGGNINFTGRILATTCDIPAASIQVPMGTFAQDELATAGAKSEPVPFKIQLNQCDAQLNGVKVKFEGQGDADDGTLLKTGTGGTDDAAGVGIQLADKDNNIVAINDTSEEYQLTPGDNSLLFKASYVSTNATTTAGLANASAAFKVYYR